MGTLLLVNEVVHCVALRFNVMFGLICATVHGSCREWTMGRLRTMAKARVNNHPYGPLEKAAQYLSFRYHPCRKHSP